MRKINLASGQRPFPKPWENIDIRDQGYQVDIIADIRTLPMIEDNTCEVLIAHHCLEHLDMSHVGGAAKEWHRILVPGGRLAVFVPNARAIAERWLAGQIDDFTFNVNMYGAYQGYPEDLHRWSYRYDYLADQMSSGGAQWSIIRPIHPQDVNNGIYAGANLAFDWWILAMEFTK